MAAILSRGRWIKDRITDTPHVRFTGMDQLTYDVISSFRFNQLKM